ncbi:MAG: hypothetical protein CMI18_12340 [Opitutaceae bacterium]|nr:hypothetical protein [Opitutaceae bacterium]
MHAYGRYVLKIRIFGPLGMPLEMIFTFILSSSCSESSLKEDNKMTITTERQFAYRLKAVLRSGSTKKLWFHPLHAMKRRCGKAVFTVYMSKLLNIPG